MNDGKENAERNTDPDKQRKISNMDKMDYLSSFYERYDSHKKEFQYQKKLASPVYR